MGKPAIQKAQIKTMEQNHQPTCGEHNQLKEWRLTTFEYEEDGISVRVPNVYAWVCPTNSEASFTPETVDDLILTVRDLLETAKRAKERRTSPTEFIVTVN